MNDNFCRPVWHPIIEMLRNVHLVHLTSISTYKSVEIKTFSITATEKIQTKLQLLSLSLSLKHIVISENAWYSYVYNKAYRDVDCARMPIPVIILQA